MIAAEKRRDSLANLSVAWIDYSKAYDKVLQKWIIKVLKWIEVDAYGKPESEVQRQLRSSTGEDYFRVIPCPPLLFCLYSSPLSHALINLHLDKPTCFLLTI